MPIRSIPTGVFLLLGLWTAPAFAAVTLSQEECKIEDSKPFQLNGAKQYVLMAANSRKDDEIPKHLANAIRVLTEAPDKIKNEPGRQYLLLRTYAQWLQKGEGRYEMNRGAMGYTTDRQGTQNLLLAVDSAATVLERMMPQCVATVRPYRQRFFTDLLNKSVEAMNADKNDSAAYYASMSLQVAGADPRPWNVLSAVYQKQNKLDSAMLAMDRVIALSGTDTLYARVKQQSRFNLAVLRLTRAEAGAGAAKEQDIKSARGLLEAYLKEAPGDANASQALGRALRLSGDTAAVVNMFGNMLKAPETFTADQLFEAASNAAAGNRDQEAVALFEAGFKKNPNHRFALYNYANVLFTAKDAARMGGAVQRLMTVDPNFDRGWRLVAGYWQLRARAESDAAKKKLFNDSTLFYLDKQTKTNPRVDVTLAARTGSAYQLQGTVVNDGAATASWTMKLELLDAAGAVVATKEVALGPIDAGASTTFAVKVEDPKAVAFRYAPLK